MDLFFLGSLSALQVTQVLKFGCKNLLCCWSPTVDKHLLESCGGLTSFCYMFKKTRKPITLSPQTNTNMWLGKVSFKMTFSSCRNLKDHSRVFFCVWIQCHPGDQQKQCRSSVELSKGHWSFWALRASLVGFGGFWANKIWLRNGHACRRLNWGRGRAEYLFVGGSIFGVGKWWMDYKSLYLPVEAILRNTDL